MATRATRIALTGGIATGKSYCLERFARLGAPVIDADVLAREAVAPGTPGLAAVARRFAGVVDAAGALDRAALSRQVFADPAARRDLERIIHPFVYDRIVRWYEELAGRPGIADIPLLFETGRERDFDAVIVAACPPALQMERLLARGLSQDEAARRLAAQMPIEQKTAKADYVIDTGGEKEETDGQIVTIWQSVIGNR